MRNRSRGQQTTSSGDKMYFESMKTLHQLLKARLIIHWVASLYDPSFSLFPTRYETRPSSQMSASRWQITYIRTEYRQRRTMPPTPAAPRQPTPAGQLRIHFYTFGHYYNRIPEPNQPLLMHVECKTLLAPPRQLCDRYTGQDAPLRDDFFSHRANEAAFQENLALLRGKLDRRKRSGGCFAVLVSCQMDMHRSVAMAERLAKSVAAMGYKSSCEHLDLAVSKAFRQRRLRKHAEGQGKAKAVENKLVKENGRLMRENERLVRENGAIIRERERWTREWMVDQNTGREQVAAAPRPHHAQPKIQNAARAQVAGAPIEYYGKPAPEIAAAFRFEKPKGWVQVTALPV